MRLDELMQSNRTKELKAVFRFIDTADFDELVMIVDEIRCCHDNLLTFNPNTKSLDRIESVCLNGEAIQLNIEED